MFFPYPTFSISTSEILDNISDWSLEVMERLGGFGAALLIALENLFPPLPSELILPLAGFAASKGEMNYFAAIAWTTSGSVVGAIALYYLGFLLGRSRIRHYASKIPLIELKDIDKAESWFTRHGNKAVFFGRMIPIVRSLISIPAGIEKMSLTLFLFYSAIGSMIWNTILITAGYQLGEQWHVVENYIEIIKYFVIAITFGFIAYFIVSKLNKRRNKTSSLD